MSDPSATAYGCAIFFNEKVCALSFRARNKSVTEDYCSWVVNYNGNINNNRNNTNDVRAVSEFQQKINEQYKRDRFPISRKCVSCDFSDFGGRFDNDVVSHNNSFFHL